MKFDPFGTSAGSVASYDWSDREEGGVSVEGRKAQASEGTTLAPPPYESGPAFGSTENLAPNPPAPTTTTTTTTTSSSSITTSTTTSSFPPEGGSCSSDRKFEDFAAFGSGEQTGDNDDDFGDFASMVSDKAPGPAATGVEAGPEEPQGEASDEFGAFHGDKAKFGKSDFLKASSQAKVKSSEEMMKNEMATFDLCVQGESLAVPSVVICLICSFVFVRVPL